MNFNTEISSGILILNLDIQRATVNESGELKEFLFNKIEKGWNRILLDLRFCGYIDSTFLGTLISASRKMIKIEGTIGIIAGYELIPSILKLTGTSKMLQVFENREQALNNFHTNNDKLNQQ